MKHYTEGTSATFSVICEGVIVHLSLLVLHQSIVIFMWFYSYMETRLDYQLIPTVFRLVVKPNL